MKIKYRAVRITEITSTATIALPTLLFASSLLPLPRLRDMNVQVPSPTMTASASAMTVIG